MISGTRKPKRDLAFPLVLLGISLFAFLAAFKIQTLATAANHDPGPRAFPWLIAGVLAAGGLLELITAFLPHPPAAPHSPSDSSHLESAPDIRTAAILLGAMIFYFVAIPWFGFFTCTLIFSVAMMKLLGTGWKLSLAASSSIVLVVYILFVQLFKVQLPSGAIGFLS